MRIATSSQLTTYIASGIAGGLAITVSIAMSLAHRRPTEPLAFDISPPVDRELELTPSSSSVSNEPPAPPKGPFYASLFVAGKTWDLPCRLEVMTRRGDENIPIGTERCHVDSVQVTGSSASAVIACWSLRDGTSTQPAVNTYVMTPEGLYIAADAPSTDGTPLFTPHPVPTSLPKSWEAHEPLQPRSATTMVWHHGAWCSVHTFESMDYIGGFAECISRHGIVGSSSTQMRSTRRCGDAPE